MTNQPAPRQPVRPPPLKVLLIALGLVAAVGLYGAYSLRAIVEESTTDKDGGNYVAGDCRIFERTTNAGTHEKYRKAKMCLQEDGTWQIVETWDKQPPAPDAAPER